jgi:hypothetical protein
MYFSNHPLCNLLSIPTRFEMKRAIRSWDIAIRALYVDGMHSHGHGQNDKLRRGCWAIIILLQW